tara:strand:- start:36 stop:224 length:189 start_codon:yes stop_codon:yes gene_type:complete
MLVNKEKLKSLISEEIERSFDSSSEGFTIAEETIKKFDTLTETQKVNFLERLFTHINKNVNI